jgi:DNA-binding Lrp family transcriptional regulator
MTSIDLRRYVAEYNAGKSFTAIANRAGITPSAMKKALLAAGAEMRDGIGNRGRKTGARLEEEIIAGKSDTRQLCERFGCSPERVQAARRRLRKQGKL